MKVIDARHRFQNTSVKGVTLQDRIRRAKQTSLAHMEFAAEYGDISSVERELGFQEAMDIIEYWLKLPKYNS